MDFSFMSLAYVVAICAAFFRQPANLFLLGKAENLVETRQQL